MLHPRSSLLLPAALVAALVLCPMTSEVQAETDGYQMPPQVLADLVDRPPTPWVTLDPTGEWLLLQHRPNLPSIAELSERELRLAGLRIKPQINGPSRTRPASGLELLRLSDGERRPFTGLPEDARIENPAFSPDGARMIFTCTRENGIELWTAEMATGHARAVTGPILNLTAGEPPRFVDGGRRVVVTVLPEGRGPEPASARVPGGPVVQENLGRTAPARTYQDLLEGPHDEALFDHYFTSQLAVVDFAGEVQRLGEPGIFWGVQPSPAGEHILVQRIVRPYSYLVPAGRFPQQVEIWDLEGNRVRRIADLPLQEEIPIGFGSVATGPRAFGWRADRPAELVWAEAQDGGDARAEAEIRDRVFLLEAPFSGEPRKLADLALRYGGVMWADDDLALVTEWWWQTRTQNSWRVAPGSAGSDPTLLFSRSFEDRYSDPGNPVMDSNRYGIPTLRRSDDGKSIFLIGAGASPEGDRPFLDRMSLEDGEKERLFHSAAPYFEQPLRLLPDGDLLTRRESPEEPPNYYVRRLGAAQPQRQVTDFPHPSEELQGIQKELIQYERADGVMLNATLYLPAGYKPTDGPLPAVLWAYPQEFKSAAAASQVDDSPYRFDRVSWASPLLWLTQGYAVIDDPAMPIIGEGDEEPNDTYVEQLVSSAAAAIDAVVAKGVVDRDRVAVGGHSYGAFMTANLLAHSDLFAAGIARSGAYNRTLTPFGFQAEERTLWEAGEVYFRMSPFMHADRVQEPLLLIHGAADNNSGTFPMQSERYYNALKGLGATVRLVMLPNESHGYRARESVMHMLWETHRWLESYVKNGSRPQPEAAAAAAGAAP